jgi:small subunit ribosomal protein S3
LSTVKRIIRDAKERMQVDELLSKEFQEAGYGGITLTKTPLGAQINLYTMRPGRVIGKKGRAIKDASEKLEHQIGLLNPQITVVEIEVPEFNPQIMAARVANALERGVHFRRSIFWSLRRIMDSGALGCEIILKGPIRSARARFERVNEGYIPKAGEPSKRYVRHATLHVKQKRGMLGVTVNIVPPDAKFPDKIDLSGLPDIEEPELPFSPEAPDVKPEEEIDQIKLEIQKLSEENLSLEKLNEETLESTDQAPKLQTPAENPEDVEKKLKGEDKKEDI